MRAPRIVVFEYGAGNVHSACHALARVGADVVLTDDSAEVRRADGVMIPGVGAFGYVMNRFESRGGAELLRECQQLGKPLLGVCVGMQIFFDSAMEKGVHRGLGLLSGVVEQLPEPRLPHMGWAQVKVPEASHMFSGIDREHFYFVHSYARLTDEPLVNRTSPGKPVVATTARHGADFVAAVETDRLWATQFHPEKSGSAGLRLLANWLRTVQEN